MGLSFGIKEGCVPICTIIEAAWLPTDKEARPLPLSQLLGLFLNVTVLSLPLGSN